MTAPVPQTLPLDVALQQALAHHQAGRLQEAEDLYRAILQAYPYQPDANHNLGVLAMQAGQKSAAGLPYLKTALTVNPANGQYALSYAEALLATGQAREALNVLQAAMQRGLNSPAAQALRQKVEVAALNSSAKGEALTPVEMSQLVALFNAGRYAELESRARFLVRQYPDSGFAWKVLGTSLQVQGKSALIALQKATEFSPGDAESHSNLGNALQALGQLDEAVASCRRALEIKPDLAEAHSNLGNALQALGQLDDAVASYRRALEIKPGYAEVHSNLGNALKDLGQLDDAVASYRRALEIQPDYAEAYYNLGVVPHDLGQLDDAVANYRRALEINPNFVEAHSNLGNALRDLGQLDDGVASYRRALEIKPDFVEAHSNLGNALRDLGQLDHALASYRRALEIKPDFAEAHYNMGIVLKDLGQLDDAVTSYRRALEIKPDYAEAHHNLGNALRILGQSSDGVASCRRAVEIKPDFAEAHNNLGSALQALGQLDDAVTSYRRALEIKPDYADAHSNLIFTLDLAAEGNIATLQQERSRWDSIHAAPLAAVRRPHANRPDPERRLRIGYVSADFRMHSAALVFGAMLVKFDPACFEVFAYSNSAIVDSHTCFLQQGVTCWRTIVGRTDEAVAELIREDEIDILVDLSGHSAGNRLLVFARKPAPIQVTAWGYATSTGMRAMDVFFADPVVVPPDERQFFTEDVRYLPNVVGSFFPQAFPAVNALRALSAEGITFGSFNRLTKISDEAYQVWVRILLAIPDSRMVFKTHELDDAGVKARVARHFTQAGIVPERVVLLGKTSWDEHMANFNQIDIALDPFPHGGGVTTLEGLMMGVPVVTLRWPTVPGRLSASILTTLGLTDWIAETPEQYVAIAIRKAQALPALADLRKQLRGIFASSIIGDSDGYVSSVEQEYRKLWQEWCDAQGRNL